MSNQILEYYKGEVWALLSKSPAQKVNRVLGSEAVGKLGMDKVQRQLVSKNTSYRFGNTVVYPKSHIDLRKTFAAQTPIGQLTMKGFNFLNKALSGNDMPFFNFVFDEIIGLSLIGDFVKYTKLGLAIFNSMPAPIQVRNGDMLFKYEMVSAKRGGILEFEYIEYLMLVDPYRKNRDQSSWVLYEQRCPLKIVEVPNTYKSAGSMKIKENNNSDTIETQPWLKKK